MMVGEKPFEPHIRERMLHKLLNHAEGAGCDVCRKLCGADDMGRIAQSGHPHHLGADRAIHNSANFLDNRLQRPPGLRYQRRVGGHAINNAPGVRFTDLCEVRGIDEDLHNSSSWALSDCTWSATRCHVQAFGGKSITRLWSLRPASNVTIVTPKRGWVRWGASSASGSRTKRRLCNCGCGTFSGRESMVWLARRRMSRSIVREDHIWVSAVRCTLIPFSC